MTRKREIPKSYPVATSTVGATTLIWLLLQFGVEVPADVAVEVTGLLALAVAYISKRTMQENIEE